jgi:hypothetical protein
MKLIALASIRQSQPPRINRRGRRGKSAPPWRGGDRLISRNARGKSPDSALKGARQADAALLRRKGLVKRIHEVAGVRGFWEFIEGLTRDGKVDEAEIEKRLSRFARLDPQILDILGANRLPNGPIRVVGGRR